MIAFRRVVTPIYTHTLRLPDAPQGQQAAQELATLPDGRTVVALFEGFTLPANQPAEIAASIEVLPDPLPDPLREQIKAASPQVALIYERTEQKIRAVYSINDEAKFARIGVGAALGVYAFGAGEQDELIAFGAFVEAAREWGRGERALLGL